MTRGVSFFFVSPVIYGEEKLNVKYQISNIPINGFNGNSSHPFFKMKLNSIELKAFVHCFSFATRSNCNGHSDGYQHIGDFCSRRKGKTDKKDFTRKKKNSQQSSEAIWRFSLAALVTLYWHLSFFRIPDNWAILDTSDPRDIWSEWWLKSSDSMNNISRPKPWL